MKMIVSRARLRHFLARSSKRKALIFACIALFFLALASMLISNASLGNLRDKLRSDEGQIRLSARIKEMIRTANLEGDQEMIRTANLKGDLKMIRTADLKGDQQMIRTANLKGDRPDKRLRNSSRAEADVRLKSEGISEGILKGISEAFPLPHLHPFAHKTNCPSIPQPKT